MGFKAKIATKPAVTADRFILCGKPGVGKTWFASTVPNAFILFVQDGSKGMAPGAEPGMFLDDNGRVIVPRTLQELHEAIELFDRMNDGRYRHLFLDAFVDIERLVHEAAIKQERGAHMESEDFKKIWAAAVPLWQRLQKYLDRVREKGVHVWVVAHGGELYETDLATTEQWKRADIEVSGSGTTATSLRTLWKGWCDHFFQLDFKTQIVKVGKGKRTRTTAEYRGRILHTRESATHYAKTRSQLPPEVVGTWPDLQSALRAGTQVPDRRARKRLDAAVADLDEAERAELVAAFEAAKTPAERATVISRAEGLAAMRAAELAEDADDAEPEGDDAPESGEAGGQPAKPAEPKSEPPPPAAADTEAPPATERAASAAPAISYEHAKLGLAEATTVALVRTVIAAVRLHVSDEEERAELEEDAFSRLIDLTPDEGLKHLAKEIADSTLGDASKAQLRQAWGERAKRAAA